MTLPFVPGHGPALSGSNGSLIYGATGFLTQPRWYVNSVTGSDLNDGSTEATAIETPDELARRFAGKVLPQDTSIQFRGTFSTDTFILDCCIIDPHFLKITGDTPVSLFSGVVGGYTPMNSGALQDSQLAAAHSFAADAGRFGRITSGPRRDVSWIFARDLGGNTARICQPVTPVDPSTQTPLAFEGTPVPGDPFAIETIVTEFHKFSLNIHGGGQLLVQDIGVIGADSETCWAWCDGPGQAAFERCRFTGIPLISGNPVFNGCSFVPQTQWDGPLFAFTRGGIFFGPVLVLNGFLQLSLNPVFQSVPNVGGESALAPSRNTYVMVSGTAYSGNGGALFADCTMGDALVGVSRGATMEVRSNATLWGKSNVSPVGVHAFTNSRFTWDGAVPLLTGNVPGVDVSVGGTLTTWAALAAAGGLLNAQNGACVAPRA